MTLHLENGKTMTITAKGNSDETRYVNSMTLNGVPYNHNFLNHTDLMNGGNIEFTMSTTPNKQRGTLDEDAPYSFSNTLKAVKTKKGKKK